MNGLKILVAEDDPTSLAILRKILQKEGYEVITSRDGVEALEAMDRNTFDILITDWMMPRVDGIELIQRTRKRGEPPVPLIIVTTALAFPEARNKAFDAGADDYLTKPYRPAEILDSIQNGMSRRSQSAPACPTIAVPTKSVAPPPFVGVGIAASTGGPPALRRVMSSIKTPSPAAFFLVQHGPLWMLKSFAGTLQNETALRVVLAEDDMPIAPNTLFVAPGDRHMIIEPERFILKLTNDPPENFVRPAADQLFRSLIKSFGHYCLAVVLTGMGCDGALGAAFVATAGGVVIVQDPKTALLASMPQTVIKFGFASLVVPLDEIGETISAHAARAGNTISKRDIVNARPRKTKHFSRQEDE